jgi:hypothetical protein
MRRLLFKSPRWEKKRSPGKGKEPEKGEEKMYR